MTKSEWEAKKKADRQEENAMEKGFEYEWWYVDITSTAGRMTWQFKGKDKAHVITQIERAVRRTNSEVNTRLPWWQQSDRIVEVHWETLKLDHVGYQRWG